MQQRVYEKKPDKLRRYEEDSEQCGSQDHYGNCEKLATACLLAQAAIVSLFVIIVSIRFVIIDFNNKKDKFP